MGVSGRTIWNSLLYLLAELLLPSYAEIKTTKLKGETNVQNICIFNGRCVDASAGRRGLI